MQNWTALFLSLIGCSFLHGQNNDINQPSFYEINLINEKVNDKGPNDTLNINTLFIKLNLVEKNPDHRIYEWQVADQILSHATPMATLTRRMSKGMTLKLKTTSQNELLELVNATEVVNAYNEILDSIIRMVPEDARENMTERINIIKAQYQDTTKSLANLFPEVVHFFTPFQNPSKKRRTQFEGTLHFAYGGGIVLPSMIEKSTTKIKGKKLHRIDHQESIASEAQKLRLVQKFGELMQITGQEAFSQSEAESFNYWKEGTYIVDLKEQKLIQGSTWLLVKIKEEKQSRGFFVRPLSKK